MAIPDGDRARRGRSGALERRAGPRGRPRRAPPSPRLAAGWRSGRSRWRRRPGGAAHARCRLSRGCRRPTTARSGADDAPPSAPSPAIPPTITSSWSPPRTALRHRTRRALHHLNRALRLHPANWQAHCLAARTLLALGRPSQAALEYRLAIERGMSCAARRAADGCSAGHVVDGCPQTPADDLIELAHALSLAPRRARPTRRRSARSRWPTVRAPLLTERVQLAIEAARRAPGAGGRGAWLDSQPEAPRRRRGRSRRWRRPATSRRPRPASMRVLKLHPGTPACCCWWARSCASTAATCRGRGSCFARAGEGGSRWPNGMRAEELLAQIADKAGDVEGAVLARARARLIAHKLPTTDLCHANRRTHEPCWSQAAPASSAPTSCVAARAPPGERLVVLDALTYAGNLASLDGVERLRVRQRRHLRRRRWSRASLRDHAIDVDRPLRRREPRRPLDPRPGRVRAHQRRRDGDAAGEGARGRRQALRARLHRRGLRRPRARRSRVHARTTPLQPRSPYSASKAGSDHLVRA